MIKTKTEISRKNAKPAFELLYGGKIRTGLILNIIVLIVVIAAVICFGKHLLWSTYYGILTKDTAYLLLLTALFIMILELAVGCTIRIIASSKALMEIHRANDEVIGMQEYEFGEDGLFSRVTKDGFLCERFSVYSTVNNVTEYKESFIVQTRGYIGAFAASDICEGDADRLRELLRQKLGERFVTKK